MKVIVTIPAFNEEKTLGNVLESIKSAVRGMDCKIVIVDDGSKDKTALVAKKAGAIVFSHPRNMGLAETFKTEMEKCLELKADIIVHFDADGQYNAKDIPKLINKVKEGYDLVLGSRFLGGIESMPWLKKLGNKAFSRVISNITKLKVTDGQTGFRAFTREVAKIPITSNFTYTQEQIIRAARGKFKIIEIPTYFAKRQGDTESRLMKGPFDYGIRAGINLLRVYRDYEPLKFFGLFGGLFFFAGLFIGIWILYLFFVTAKVTHLPSAILSMLLIIVGIQILLFGFLADMNRK